MAQRALRPYQAEAIIIAGSILARALLIGFVVMASNGL